MTTQPAKISPLFIGLAVITLGLSSWGLYHLFVDFAAAPWWFAVAVIGGLDLAAVAFGKHALTVSADGDSPALWNLLLLAFMALAARVQYNHAMLADWPQIIGITMAAFPVATVLLFEGQLRRVARVNGRAQGVEAAPRRKVPLLVWIHFPRRAWHATRQAILAQGHLEDKTKPRQARRTAGSNRVIPPGEPEAQSGLLLGQEVATSLNAKPQPVPKQPGQSVAASAAAAADRLDSRDIETVWAEVRRTTHPDVSRDTVRKSLSRIPTNGQHREVSA